MIAQSHQANQPGKFAPSHSQQDRRLSRCLFHRATFVGRESRPATSKVNTRFRD